MRAAIRQIVREAHRLRDRLRLAKYYQPTLVDTDHDQHLREAAAWLCRAQDTGNDRGVAYGVPFGGTYQASYPETTGYIIPTFLALEAHLRDPAYGQRALDAALWEVDIQLPNGAVMAGRFNTSPKPAVFNTGQVLIGWASIGRVSSDARFERAADAACRWMLSIQEPEGRWLGGHSPRANPETAVYNVKAAWGMCEAGVLWGWPSAVDGAIRNAEFSLANQLSNGWFRDCCLNDGHRPLLHTIAYSVQGLLGISLLTGRQDIFDGAKKTADVLLDRMSPEGFLPGRFASDWSAAVSWCCLTGSAQMSNVWSDLFQLTGDQKYRSARDVINGYLVRRHDISNPDPAIRGGVPGSWPTWGDYGRFKILNWATKFLVDALLAEQGCARPHVFADRAAGPLSEPGRRFQ